MKIGVLISGRGTNLQALLEAAADADFPAEIAIVVSNRPDVQGLERAKNAGVPAVVIDHKTYRDRTSFEEALTETLETNEVELVCLAGFMRLLTATFVDRWLGRAVNIHPSLLPAFPGLDTHARAIASGAKFAGATVHFLSSGMDEGAIIAQAATPILPEDDAETLAARVLQGEHEIYVRAVRWIAEGRARLIDGAAILENIGDAASCYLPAPSGQV